MTPPDDFVTGNTITFGPPTGDRSVPNPVPSEKSSEYNDSDDEPISNLRNRAHARRSDASDLTSPSPQTKSKKKRGSKSKGKGKKKKSGDKNIVAAVEKERTASTYAEDSPDRNDNASPMDVEHVDVRHTKTEPVNANNGL